jgi:mannose-6-phosphate isomerase-like protein (cupin superfamily)
MSEVVELPILDEEHVPTLEQIERLQREMSVLPQLELETEHYFSGGMYCRKLTRPAGTVIVGKVHKKEHFFMCAKGEIRAWSEKGMVTLKAGDVICSKAGTKRVTLALTDAIGITFHVTDKTNLDEIEAELIEPNDMALFDANNKLKFDVPAFRELTAKVIAAEKVGFWSDWTEEQQALYTANKWREFSVSRGYSDEEIADYAAWRDMIQKGKDAGLNPYVFIKDLATEAAIRNIEMDKNNEILKSSHAPFEPRGETL